MSIFEWQKRTCPGCGDTFDALALWDADTPCGDCGRKRYEQRLATINEGRPYTVESIGGACPTQAEGRTPDDRPYYFRARHGEWTLRVGEPGWPTCLLDWPDDGDGTYVDSGDDDTHGWMENPAVLAILDRNFGSPA